MDPPDAKHASVAPMTAILVPYHLDEYLADLDVPVPADRTVARELPEGDAWSRMAVLYEAVAEAVAETARGGARSVVLSGDCTTSLATMAGLQRAGIDPAIVWFDAHGDVQTLETTTSGYLGGIPLRILVGYRPELIVTGLGLRATAEERVLLVDARDLDPPEVEYLERAAIRRSGVEDLSAGRLPPGPLYLHFDADVVTAGELDGLRFPAPGGPGLGAVVEALRRVIGSGRVVAFGVGCTWHAGHGAAERIAPPLEALLAHWD
jgi:arginase